MNQEIQVKFPDKITVNAPNTDQAIDALKISFENLYELLEENTNALITALGEFREEVPKTARVLGDLIAQQFSLSILKNLEAFVITHQAHLLSDQKQIESLRHFLEQKQHQIEEDQQQIFQRYSKVLSDIAQNNADRRLRLDNHAYQILDLIYPKQVQERFSTMSLPSYSYIAAHATESALVRTSALLDSFKSAELAINSTLETYEQASDEINQLINHDVEPGVYSIPVWVAEIEELASGHRRIEILLRQESDELPTILKAAIENSARLKLGSLRRLPMSKEITEQIQSVLENSGQVPKSEMKRLANDLVEWIER